MSDDRRRKSSLCFVFAIRFLQLMIFIIIKDLRAEAEVDTFVVLNIACITGMISFLLALV